MKNNMILTSIILVFYFATQSVQGSSWENYTYMEEASVLLNDNNDLWIGTRGGLILFDKINETFPKILGGDGLPSNNIQCLYKDTVRNQLWVGTDYGVAMFDGASWEPHTPEDGGVPIRNIRDVKGDKDGNIWIAGGRHAGPLDPYYFGPTYAKFQGGEWKPAEFDEFTGWDSPIGFCLDVTPSGDFYCGTDRGLYHIMSESWQKLEAPNNVMAIAWDEQNNDRWIGTSEGLYKIRNGVVERKLDDSFSIKEIAIEGPDELWLVNESGVLIKYKDGNISQPLDIEGKVFDVIVDQDKTLWIAYEKGIIKKVGEQLKSYSFASGLKSNSIRCLDTDSRGAVWFSAALQQEDILGCFAHGEWSYFNAPLRIIAKLYVDSRDRVWAVIDDGIYFFKDNEWTRFAEGEKIVSISENRDGSLWFGGNSHILFRTDGDLQNRQDFADKLSGYPSRSVTTAILEDEKTNILWIGLSNGGGIIKLNLSDFTSVYWDSDNSELPYSDVQALRRHPDDAIWAAFGVQNQGGLYFYQNDEWRRAPVDYWGREASYVSDIEIDELGRVWFTMYGWNPGGTYGGGLGMFDGDSWHRYKTNNSGLSNNYATSLAIEQDGSIWISTLGGISHFTPPGVPVSVHRRSLTSLKSYRLNAAYPNPFNSSTRITYELPQDGFVALKIYDVAGRLVRVLVQEHKTSGAYTIVWDGLDDAGRQVAAGVYLYRLEFTDAAGERMVLTRKMSLVR